MPLYPPANGRQVWPVAYEAWGRAGPQADNLLTTLLGAARRRAHRRGRDIGNELQRWRAHIDGALMRVVAMQIASSASGLPGRRPYRPRPIDITAIEAETKV